MPYWTAASIPSAKGKNASEAMTAPIARPPALCPAIITESTRLIWPAPTPTVAGQAPECACGGRPMRFVAAGISKSTGKPYRAFYACPKPQGQACSHKAQP